jgi:hypothetical protein
MTPSCHAAANRALKAKATCANDKKQKKELTDHLRCLDGLRSGGSVRCLFGIDEKSPERKLFELTDGSH